MGKRFPEFVVPPAPLDFFEPGYPSEVSQKWWKEVGEFYNNQTKAAFAATAKKSLVVYNEPKLSTAENDHVKVDETVKSPAVDKPLPALPQPYFEYLFADAGIEDKAANKTFTAVVDPVSPPYKGTPDVDVDMSAFSQYVFHQANVPTFTKRLTYKVTAVDTEIAAPTVLTTVAASYPVTGEKIQLEKEKEVDDFLEGLAAKIVPFVNHNHQTAVATRACEDKEPHTATQGDETSGASIGHESAAIDHATSESVETAGSPASLDMLLKPMTYEDSNVNPNIKSNIKSIAAKWIERRQQKGQSPVINTSAHNSVTSSLKRAARDSWATRSATSNSDEPVEYLGTKRVRTDSPVQAVNPANDPNLIEAGIFFRTGAQSGTTLSIGVQHTLSTIDLATLPTTNSRPAPEVINLITPDAPSYTPIDTHIPTPLTDNYKGFPGQFVGIALNTLAAKTKLGAMKKPKVTIFGDYSHANGPIIHKNCYPAPTTPEWNYSHDNLPRHSVLFRAMEDLDFPAGLAQTDGVALLRTDAQEDLRREAHLELASARLEGVCVGEYRYYQGHLSVEEYVDRGLCVCWAPCACSRVCSRFGDVMCPCGGDLELEQDGSEL